MNDAQGHALMVNQGGRIQRQLVVNGEVLGRYGEALDANANNGSFIQIADFNFGYQPISGSYPSASPGVYSVLTGDTLKSIAQGAYGDSKLWYRIAEANGLSGDADLRVGQALTIPAGVGTIHNDSSVFKPYDPTKITGDTTPNLPVPSSGGGCGGMGMVIVAVVAVVAAVMTQQYYLAPQAVGAASATGAAAGGSAAAAGGAVAATTATTSQLITAGALAGAAGSVAGQVAGNILGVQSGFDWRGVALGALSGAVGGGMSSLATGNGLLSGTGLGVTVARAAVGNAFTQGIGIVTGLQSSFNWRGVAASAAGSGAGWQIGEQLGLQAQGMTVSSMGLGEKLLKSTLAGLGAGAVTAIARGGRVAVQQVATDAFGNALGESIAGANGQSARSAGGSDSLDAFLALNDNFSGSSYTFADSMAGRQAANNPMGLPTSSATGDAGSLYARNGMDVMDDTTDASGRRAVTVGRGQGPMAAFGSAGMSSDQAQAMYGQALANGQIGRNTAGVPIVQPGQTLYVDLNDMSQAGLAGRAIAQESSMRSDRAATAAQMASNAYSAGAGRGSVNYSDSDYAAYQNDVYNAGEAKILLNRSGAGQSFGEIKPTPTSVLKGYYADPNISYAMDHSMTGAVIQAGASLIRFGGDVWGSTIGKLTRDDGLAVNPLTGDILSNKQVFDTRLGALLMAAPVPKALGWENGGAVSVYRKMSTVEADATLSAMELQPAIAGRNSSKYLSESLSKVEAFQNKAALNTQQDVVEFMLDKRGYENLMNSSVNQIGSKGVDAIKYNFEGVSGTGLRNLGVPSSQLESFNSIIFGVRKVTP